MKAVDICKQKGEQVAEEGDGRKSQNKDWNLSKVLTVISNINIGSLSNKSSPHLIVAIGGGEVEAHAPAAVLHVQLRCRLTQKQTNDSHMNALSRQVEG